MTTAIGSNPYSAATYGAQTSVNTADHCDKRPRRPVPMRRPPLPARIASATCPTPPTYLASQATDAASLTDTRRASGFDDQYKATGLTSPMLDGSVALDMTSLSR